MATNRVDGLHGSPSLPTLYSENHPSLYQGGGCVSTRVLLLLCLLLALAGCGGNDDGATDPNVACAARGGDLGSGDPSLAFTAPRATPWRSPAPARRSP